MQRTEIMLGTRRMTRRVLLLLFLMLATFWGSAQSNYYVSPTGVDSNPGSRSQPFQSISAACSQAGPGDTVFLLPGKYLGTNRLTQIHGRPNQPLTILSFDPNHLAVIDGQSDPSNTAFHPGIALENCSWINICGIKFERCWNSAVDLKESNYISVQYCHFTTGKWVVHPHGHKSHHVLVEHCMVHHPPQIWKGWSWLEIHHGALEHYNGALLHPRKSAGGHIMRSNTLRNLFNGFRTRPESIIEDGNTEIYANKFINIRDNEFEPEGWAWNMHYYQNDHVNIHKLYSIDGVKGGNIYIHGNTHTQANDPWTNYQVSGIYKYKGGPITEPCYVFNNSYFTTARVMKYGESSNHQMKHFNNAYQFFETKDAFRVVNWQPGYEFDYDCINQDWSENIKKHFQEQHGLPNTEPGFNDPKNGDFTLTPSSPLIDRGKKMSFPAFDWQQTYLGDAPDIGAYEGSKRMEGPPFRFIPSPVGALYQEYPRITRHYCEDKYLLIHLSAPLAPQDLTEKIKLYHKNKLVRISSVLLFSEGFDLLITVNEPLQKSQIALEFDHDILGRNGLPLVQWGSTIPGPSNLRSTPNLDFQNPWIDDLPAIRRVDISHQIDAQKKELHVEIKIKPKVEIIYRGILGLFSEDDVYLDGAYANYTKKGGIYKIDIGHYEKGNYQLVLLVAGKIYRKDITL